MSLINLPREIHTDIYDSIIHSHEDLIAFAWINLSRNNQTIHKHFL